jgi:hypothetical protein
MACPELLFNGIGEWRISSLTGDGCESVFVFSNWVYENGGTIVTVDGPTSVFGNCSYSQKMPKTGVAIPDSMCCQHRPTVESFPHLGVEATALSNGH